MKLFTGLLKESRFHILQINTQTFEPHGFTAVWILAESHLALHTFPENGKTYIELSSCNEQKFLNFKSSLEGKWDERISPQEV